MIISKFLGKQSYHSVWENMKQFTLSRTADTTDELWLLEHYPVYTQGQAGKAEHILNHNSIPIVQSDRGGQITYHGPGQLVAYLLMDIRRKNLGIKSLVCKLERALVALLEGYGINANIKIGAPGVYVEEKKIASVGLRVKNGCTYHGIALNIAMDLKPFNDINPCGYAKMEMTQMSDYIKDLSLPQIAMEFEQKLMIQLDN